MANDNYYVKCPFYKKDKSTEIRCEGLTDESRIVQQFQNKRSKEEYLEKFCKDEKTCTQCEIYKSIMKKY